MDYIKYKEKFVKLKHLKNLKEIDNGKGANGQVFKCYHELHALEYAVKVWFPRDKDEEVSEERFLSEIQKIKTTGRTAPDPDHHIS